MIGSYERAEEIRKLKREGMSNAKLAEMYDVTINAISRVIRRVSYAEGNSKFTPLANRMTMSRFYDADGNILWEV
jgi:hypothetical protein